MQLHLSCHSRPIRLYTVPFVSIANLRSFPCVSILEDRNRLSLHGAWFDIAEGELWTMNPATGGFSRAG